ncbi:helix-turn-helix domain-containing protein [Leisingera sp. ANG-S3]|uniref:helix-turn-helix domain-containing protein n=1 Tax=Leisingera sp. ANG-S3 TaxID=1577899 RepID=UPI00057F98F3|nr:helix-turn-helix domain-containing protein [Leisingera sp. ANG-S3]KIC23379.1 hypothetical protein RA23_15025 [Leisingera sp. ANG-S3]
MSHHNDPGTATVAQIARHWGLTPPTVRNLLKRSGAAPVSTGPKRYLWREIWALEGARYVPRADEAEFLRPLLTPTEVGRLFPHLKPRTITDRALKGSLPAIRLGTDWRFRECDVRKAAILG